MEPAKILFQASDDQRLVSTASQSELNLFAHNEILGIKYVCVDQFKRAPPVLFRLLLCRHLRNQHRVHEQCLVSGVGVHAQVADVIGVIDKDAVRKNEMYQRRMPLWAPGLWRALHENSQFLVKAQSFRSGKNYLRAAGADPSPDAGDPSGDRAAPLARRRESGTDEPLGVFRPSSGTDAGYPDHEPPQKMIPNY